MLLLAFSLPAWARSYHISKFNSTIHVDEDGSARVEEQITFVFSGEYQGIYRDIPVDYPGPGRLELHAVHQGLGRSPTKAATS